MHNILLFNLWFLVYEYVFGLDEVLESNRLWSSDFWSGLPICVFYMESWGHYCWDCYWICRSFTIITFFLCWLSCFFPSFFIVAYSLSSLVFISSRFLACFCLDGLGCFLECWLRTDISLELVFSMKYPLFAYFERKLCLACLSGLDICCCLDLNTPLQTLLAFKICVEKPGIILID